jgi:BirA family transcriptional regulator, biotin operon repressor / biotin---[acetyl-CoA-carboxylase] ligase
MSPAEKLDRLIPDQLKAELPRTTIIGRDIIVVEQTGSTNDAILEVAFAEGAAVSLKSRGLGQGGGKRCIPEGLVLFAEHQTSGRGQHGNRWESTAGKGLWFSILLRPEIQLSDSGRLTIWAVEAISSVFRAEFELEPVVKLPNDVQIRGRKVAGVLVEMRAQSQAPHLAVVGIGINVNQSDDDFPMQIKHNAISLGMAVGRQIERHDLAAALLRKLDLTYRERFSKAAVAEGADIGSRIAHATLPRSTPAATGSPAPTTTRGKRVAKSPTA